MSIETDFVDALDAHAPLTALVGTSISKNVIDQSAARPLVVFNTNQEPQFGLGETALATQAAITVECWGDTGPSAAAVADAVAAALVAYNASQTSSVGTVVARSGVYDSDLDLHGEVLTVEWWSL